MRVSMIILKSVIRAPALASGMVTVMISKIYMFYALINPLL